MLDQKHRTQQKLTVLRLVAPRHALLGTLDAAAALGGLAAGAAAGALCRLAAGALLSFGAQRSACSSRRCGCVHGLAAAALRSLCRGHDTRVLLELLIEHLLR